MLRAIGAMTIRNASSSTRYRDNTLLCYLAAGSRFGGDPQSSAVNRPSDQAYQSRSAAQLEIFAPGFYTFSRFRYLEAVPSPTSRVASRRLGYHGRRLDRRHLRRNRIVDSPRSWPLIL